MKMPIQPKKYTICKCRRLHLSRAYMGLVLPGCLGARGLPVEVMLAVQHKPCVLAARGLELLGVEAAVCLLLPPAARFAVVRRATLALSAPTVTDWAYKQNLSITCMGWVYR